MLSKISLLLFFCICMLYANCQIDTTYVKPFNLGFSLKASIDKKKTYFSEIESSESTEKFRTYRSPSITIGIGLRDYSFSVSKSLDFIIPKTSRKRTKTLEFEYHGYKRSFIYDIFLQKHQGYEMEIGKDQYKFYPNLKTNFYGANFYYVLNHKTFSYRAIYSQNEKQLKNSGSFILGASVYYSVLKNDSVLFEEIGKERNNLQFGVSGGYAYTWTYEYVQFSASGIVGLNIGSNEPKYFLKKELFFYPTYNIRAGIVYNKDEDKSFGFNLLYNLNYLHYKDDNRIGLNNTQIMFSFVKRFNWGNKFVNKNIDKINQVKAKFGL